ncbi:hypothetical protein ACE198_14680 [Neobacillus sp. KR4-4]|uniref:hypothetical protein n=1 Tax=Neobacillus sp. KR4-4 TaxID=3344872 RepID=UPI0035CB1D7D
MSVKNQVESFIDEYNQKLQELQGRLQDASERAEYLQLEIRPSFRKKKSLKVKPMKC